MGSFDRVICAMPAPLRDKLAAGTDGLLELRLRAGRRMQLVYGGDQRMLGDPVSGDDLAGIVGALLEFSLYAWEDELSQGFFTVEGGCRVGVSGRHTVRNGALGPPTRIQGICVRIAREVPGCADPLMRAICTKNGVSSALIVSRPGMGKTTCLRDVARQLSARGFNVAIADERGEIAALKGGVPAMDVGERSDVMDMCPKHIAISHMVRAMSPDVILTDELGDARDAQAVNDARRCGVSVIATAHAASIGDAMRRPALSGMAGAFEVAALLGERPGNILEVRNLTEGYSWE